MNSVVYLSGPITGNSYEECIEWRNYAKSILESKKFVVICPMRGKAYLSQEKSLKDSYEELIHSSKHTIYKRDRFDTAKCDILLCNFLGAKQISIGTISEMAWADAWHKFIVVVMEDKNVHIHAFIKEMATVILPDLDKALDYIIETFGNNNG